LIISGKKEESKEEGNEKYETKNNK